MKTEDIVETIFVVMGLVCCVAMVRSEPAFELTPENLWKYTALSLGLVVFYLTIFVGKAYSRMIRGATRKKSGLRREWHYEDLDELEERIKKLEEKKDP